MRMYWKLNIIAGLIISILIAIWLTSRNYPQIHTLSRDILVVTAVGVVLTYARFRHKIHKVDYKQQTEDNVIISEIIESNSYVSLAKYIIHATIVILMIYSLKSRLGISKYAIVLSIYTACMILNYIGFKQYVNSKLYTIINPALYSRDQSATTVLTNCIICLIVSFLLSIGMLLVLNLLYYGKIPISSMYKLVSTRSDYFIVNIVLAIMIAITSVGTIQLPILLQRKNQIGKYLSNYSISNTVYIKFIKSIIIQSPIILPVGIITSILFIFTPVIWYAIYEQLPVAISSSNLIYLISALSAIAIVIAPMIDGYIRYDETRKKLNSHIIFRSVLSQINDHHLIIGCGKIGRTVVRRLYQCAGVKVTKSNIKSYYSDKFAVLLTKNEGFKVLYKGICIIDNKIRVYDEPYDEVKGFCTGIINIALSDNETGILVAGVIEDAKSATLLNHNIISRSKIIVNTTYDFLIPYLMYLSKDKLISSAKSIVTFVFDTATKRLLESYSKPIWTTIYPDILIAASVTTKLQHEIYAILAKRQKKLYKQPVSIMLVGTGKLTYYIGRRILELCENQYIPKNVSKNVYLASDEERIMQCENEYFPMTYIFNKKNFKHQIKTIRLRIYKMIDCSITTFNKILKIQPDIIVMYGYSSMKMYKIYYCISKLLSGKHYSSDYYPTFIIEEPEKSVIKRINDDNCEITEDSVIGLVDRKINTIHFVSTINVITSKITNIIHYLSPNN